MVSRILPICVNTAATNAISFSVKSLATATDKVFIKVVNSNSFNAYPPIHF